MVSVATIPSIGEERVLVVIVANPIATALCLCKFLGLVAKTASRLVRFLFGWCYHCFLFPSNDKAQRRGLSASAGARCWAAFSAIRWRKGSEYRCDRSQRIISSWFMPAISSLSRSRICRMVWTQSKDFDLDSFIAWNLPRGSDL